MKRLPATTSGGAITAVLSSCPSSLMGSMYLYKTPGLNSTDKICDHVATNINNIEITFELNNPKSKLPCSKMYYISENAVEIKINNLNKQYLFCYRQM